MSTPLRYYQILGLPPRSSPAAVRQAYRVLSKRYHPDTSPLVPEVALRRFQELQEAYAVLSNASLKATCDAILAQWAITAPEKNIGMPMDGRAETVSSEEPPTWRDFSSGEMFVLVLFAATFALCGLLVLILMWV